MPTSLSTDPAASLLTIPAGQSLVSILAGRRSIAAGGTVTQPLEFESTAVAIAKLYATSGKVTARIGTTQLIETNLGTGFSAFSLILTESANFQPIVTIGGDGVTTVLFNAGRIRAVPAGTKTLAPNPTEAHHTGCGSATGQAPQQEEFGPWQ